MGQTNLQRDSHLCSNEPRYSAESAVGGDSCRGASHVCVDDVCKRAGINPPTKKIVSWIDVIRGCRHEQVKEPAKEEHHADCGDVHMSLTDPCIPDGRQGQEQHGYYGAPESHLFISEAEDIARGLTVHLRFAFPALCCFQSSQLAIGPFSPEDTPEDTA